MRRVAPSAPGAGQGPPPRGLKPGLPPALPAPPPPRLDGGGAVAPPPGRAPAPVEPQVVAPPPAAEPQPAARSQRVADAVVAALLLALGVLVIASSVRMGIGWGSDGPESGFVPFWLAVVLVGCCVYTAIRTARRAPGKVFVRRAELARVLQVLLPAAAMIGVTPLLGIYVAGALYMACYMRLAGRYSWAASVALPLAFTLTMFLVFERWFLVPLPKGPLEAWLGY